jgi:hypothetical protein
MTQRTIIVAGQARTDEKARAARARTLAFVAANAVAAVPDGDARKPELVRRLARLSYIAENWRPE